MFCSLADAITLPPSFARSVVRAYHGFAPFGVLCATTAFLLEEGTLPQANGKRKERADQALRDQHGGVLL